MTPLLSSVKNKWLLGMIIIQNILTIAGDLYTYFKIICVSVQFRGVAYRHKYK